MIICSFFPPSLDSPAGGAPAEGAPADGCALFPQVYSAAPTPISVRQVTKAIEDRLSTENRRETWLSWTRGINKQFIGTTNDEVSRFVRENIFNSSEINLSLLTDDEIDTFYCLVPTNPRTSFDDFRVVCYHTMKLANKDGEPIKTEEGVFITMSFAYDLGPTVRAMRSGQNTEGFDLGHAQGVVARLESVADLSSVPESESPKSE